MEYYIIAVVYILIGRLVFMWTDTKECDPLDQFAISVVFTIVWPVIILLAFVYMVNDIKKNEP